MLLNNTRVAQKATFKFQSQAVIRHFTIYKVSDATNLAIMAV